MKTLILTKSCPVEGELVGVVGLKDLTIAVQDSRHAKPMHIGYKTKQAASENLDNILGICVERGWIVKHVHFGGPNFG